MLSIRCAGNRIIDIIYSTINQHKCNGVVVVVVVVEFDANVTRHQMLYLVIR